jgi:D-alanyl-D-alanine carboxypeptidase/D-alanyl-D-alanine-endopeptidase (penicillin-binding protein 4)
VRRVAGDLVVDPRPFKEPEQNRDWAPDDFEYDYAAGTSVISLNWNVIEFKVAPTSVGAPAKVSVFPADPSIVIRTVPVTGYRNDLQVQRLASGRNEFAIRGTVAGPGEQIFYRPVNGIPLWAGNVSAQMLRERGIAFAGSVAIGSNPLAEQVLWEHRSPPLRTLVRQMLIESDNHIAEQLLRIVGTHGGDSLTVPAGSERSGAMVEQAYLQSHDVPTPGLQIVDGSGLALGNRVAPITFVKLLQTAAITLGSDYVTAFARAGIEGTVRHHDVGAARGYVRAKSGHIGGVNTLVGYVQSKHHGRMEFAFMVNAPGADDMDSIEDAVDKALQGLYGL